MAEPQATLAELRQQIFANAMKAFPKVVQDFTRANNTRRTKPEDVFGIITTTGVEVDYDGVHIVEGFTASITYGEPPQYQEALKSPEVASRHEAMLSLLESTQVLLAEIFEDGREMMDDMGMVQSTGSTVDRALLA